MKLNAEQLIHRLIKLILLLQIPLMAFLKLSYSTWHVSAIKFNFINNDWLFNGAW